MTLNHLRRFLETDKWRLEVMHTKAGFHAQIWCPHTNQGHGHLNDSLVKALDGLNEYLADKQP